MIPNDKNQNVTEDDDFDPDQPAELSPETLARGTRYLTETERATLLKNIASLPIDDEAKS
jgi:hypothetical protein